MDGLGGGRRQAASGMPAAVSCFAFLRLLALSLLFATDEVVGLSLKAKDAADLGHGSWQAPAAPAPAAAAPLAAPAAPAVPAVAAAAAPPPPQQPQPPQAPPGMQPPAAAAEEAKAEESTTLMPVQATLQPVEGPQFQARETPVKSQSLAGAIIDSASETIESAGIKALDPPGDVEVEAVDEDASHVVPSETVRRIVSVKCLDEHYANKDTECDPKDYIETPPAFVDPPVPAPSPPAPAMTTPVAPPKPAAAGGLPPAPGPSGPVAGGAPSAAPPKAPPAPVHLAASASSSTRSKQQQQQLVATTAPPPISLAAAAEALGQAVSSAIQPTLVAQAAASALELSPLEIGSPGDTQNLLRK